MSSINNIILYSPLEINEIRLLFLLPRSGDEAIYYELVIVKLKNKGKEKVLDYHALLYIWGGPQSTSQIYISGAPFEIRSNLFEALKQLCSTYFPRCLWVDAICTYFDRYWTEHYRNLRFQPLFSEEFRFALFLNNSIPSRLPHAHNNHRSVIAP